VPVAEAAIVVDGPPLARFHPVGPTGERIASVHVASVGGFSKLLSECQVQFDVVDAPAEFERYGLVVVPDSVEVGEELAERLNAFLADGGAVIASHRSLRLGDGLWPVALRGAFRGASEFSLPFTRVEGDLFEGFDRYVDYDFALYSGADRWQVQESDEVAVYGRLTEPIVRRSEKSWQSAPPERRTEYATIVLAGGLAATSFPLGASYFEHGYWFYREVFTRLLNRLLPQPLVTTSAPQSAEVTVTHQEATGQRGARWIVHVVNYSPLRRSRDAIEFLEDPIPLHNIQIGLAVDAPVTRVHDARTNTELPLERSGERWQTTVPTIPIAAMVTFEEELRAQ
jgi:hypothetical protein